MLGVATPEGDAENAAVLATFFKRVGLSPEQVIIKVNNRRLMDDRFDAFNILAEKRLDCFLVDRPARENDTGSLAGLWQ